MITSLDFNKVKKTRILLYESVLHCRISLCIKNNNNNNKTKQQQKCSDSILRRKKWRLYILLQYHANLAQPMKYKKSQNFAAFFSAYCVL